jgi:pimeloyl-ACP methyl ester carboxylesterase
VDGPVSGYDTLDVPVRGGSLRVGRWAAPEPDAPVVLAAHGVTANHVSWKPVAEHTGLTVLAPDLRGRGRSASLVGAAGMAQHAEDLLAVLDHLGVERASLAGHSMGGFVVAAFAELHPERTGGVLLVDGGLPLPSPPPGVTTDQALAATIGPAAQRLTMTFESVDAYFDFWRPHPAIGPAWSADVEAYLAYDLVGEPPRLRSGVSIDAVRDDSADMLAGDDVARRPRALPAGTVFLRAPYGLMAEEGGLYPRDLLDAHAAAYPGIEVREVADVNHYTVLLGEPGATVVAKALEEVALR